MAPQTDRALRLKSNENGCISWKIAAMSGDRHRCGPELLPGLRY
jgi:hypothetical protein